MHFILWNEVDLKAQRALKKEELEAKKEKREIEEARKKCKLENQNIGMILFLNYLTSCDGEKDGESELESLGKAGSVDKKKLLSASAKISARLNRCAEFQSEKDQVLEKLMKLSEVDS